MVMTANAIPVLPSPPELGLPEKFTSWRPKQAEAVLRASDSPKRFVVLCMPTGSGKSLTYAAVAHLNGMRAAFLTSTKGLQDQIVKDFEEIGMVDVRGMGNYPCRKLIEENPVFIANPNYTMEIPKCDEGPCTAGGKCEYRSAGCLYYDAVSAARASRLVATNYAYWLHSNAYSDEGWNVDLLVLDEAHNAPEELGSFLGVEVTVNQLNRLLEQDFPRDHDDWGRWQEWARETARLAVCKAGELEEEIKEGRANARIRREYRESKRLATNMGRVGGANGKWVHHIRRVGSKGTLTLHFDPVWPGEYAEKYLFRRTKKIIMTSATVRPKTLELLGIPPSEVDFYEVPSTFPVARRPVIWSPTVRVDHRMTGADAAIWVNKIDRIIDKYLAGTRGIIHTVSYARRDFIIGKSAHAAFMVTHDTGTTRGVVERFKAGKTAPILVSPSMSTGWDFPYDECRFQIICKVPFPDSRDKIIKARTERDKGYAYYLTMQALVQASGRGMRAEDDQCDTWIVDDHIGWYMGKWGREFAPRWFIESFIKR